MKPDDTLITIDDNESRIRSLLMELVLEPRKRALYWATITKQTPNMKIGYPGQHLASLVTGMEGSRTAARGDDLVDGTEVKSCSRVDQLDSCLSCKRKLLRIEPVCPHCSSRDIKRNNDSKWLFSVKSEAELELITKKIDRVFLTISDYPNFDMGDFDTIRFQAFEIWNNEERHRNFSTILNNYYQNIFLEHISRNPNKTPAPKNLWPYSYQFYLCNPVKVFEVTVRNANTSPDVDVSLLVSPYADRSDLVPEAMPTSLLGIEEFKVLARPENEYVISAQLQEGTSFGEFVSLTSKRRIDKHELGVMLPSIDERTRGLLSLRDTDRIAESKTYKRR